MATDDNEDADDEDDDFLFCEDAGPESVALIAAHMAVFLLERKLCVLLSS